MGHVGIMPWFFQKPSSIYSRMAVGLLGHLVKLSVSRRFARLTRKELPYWDENEGMLLGCSGN